LQTAGYGAFGFLLGLSSIWINSGILWVTAWVYGGRGSFREQTYLISLIDVPLGIVAALATIIPCIGFLVAVAAGVYGIVLTIFALMVAHAVSGGRATLIWLTPTIIGIVLVCLCYALIVAIVLAITMATFQTL
jgi:hypothetical protein